MAVSPPPDPLPAFLDAVRSAVERGELHKLVLGRYRGTQGDLRRIIVRPVKLKAGPRLSFVWRHATRDETRNLAPEAGQARVRELLAGDFGDAHLYTAQATVHLETNAKGRRRMRSGPAEVTGESTSDHDRARQRPLPLTTPWLATLGVTTPHGRLREGQAGKYRQVNRFSEILQHLLEEAFPGRVVGDSRTGGAANPEPLRIVDMGCGKGYLTFALTELLGEGARVEGVEQRRELVVLGNEAARQHGFSGRLQFHEGRIDGWRLGAIDVLVALHACDTATDDAMAAGFAAGARLMLFSPCCHKEVRRQIVPPPILTPVFRHGILREREAEFVTDALRALLLEWAGYRTKLFEFISTEHTAKNLMIAAVWRGADDGQRVKRADRVRGLAQAYGISRQHLADRLHFDLQSGGGSDSAPRAEFSDEE